MYRGGGGGRDSEQAHHSLYMDFEVNNYDYLRVQHVVRVNELGGRVYCLGV